MNEKYVMRVTAQDLRNVDAVLKRKDGDENYLEAIAHYIMYANLLGQNYVFIDKNILYPEIIDKLRDAGYNIVTGQGDVARIKISW